MITVELAKDLRAAGLRWNPETGDRFVIDKPGVDDDVYTVSEMTVERHDHPSGTILGFNGTTEWALDSVTAAESLWLPREDQLRELLGPSFVGLTRVAAGERVVHTVTVVLRGDDRSFAAADPAIAYGQALVAYITTALE
ncbi:hypothetical protein GA0004736_1090 [Curtobacterium sp. 9128]|uniref:pilus assembly protein CpaE n=1 Tax=Curtobacterium sp. 9128 TaxID=1793722 RepID=UPI0007D730D1|nr:pilus assembly protein CpaE [Curtobacterium sp. 9128]SBN62190.1 hypothetical protein GA0004736_1090 [Curtobacterium sp. 9128]